MPLRKTSLIAMLAALYFAPGLLFLYVARGVSAEVPSSAVMTSPGEPGEPFHVTGTVYGPDGVTPAARMTVYAFHTDAEGLYSETNDNTNPRLNATIWTDARGRYELRTIRPAPYPGGGIPAHIHYRISGSDFPDQGFELHFEGDPHLSARTKDRSAKRGRFGSIRPLERGEDGVWHCVFDMKLRR